MGDTDTLLIQFCRPPTSKYHSFTITPFLYAPQNHHLQQQHEVSISPLYCTISCSLSFTMSSSYLIIKTFSVILYVFVSLEYKLIEDIHTTTLINLLLQYLHFVESKYPHRERRDYTASAPYRREANRFPPSNDSKCRITRDIDWSARRPPAGVNFSGVQECYVILYHIPPASVSLYDSYFNSCIFPQASSAALYTFP